MEGLDDNKKPNNKPIKVGTEHKKSDINHCKWCGGKTVMERMLLSETPILEFLELKINMIGRDEVWGENSDWSELHLDSDVEAELLIYDEMLGNMGLKYVCERCLTEDDRLWDKYYGTERDGYIDFDLEY